MGTIYMVGTPIGNLGDFTFRAKEILEKVAIIACEDTRVTGKLLQHYQITTPTVSLHQHSDDRKIEQLLDKVTAGRDMAVVTDAGMPGVSDPGGLVVARAAAKQIPVLVIPGPSALTAAMAVSGLPTDHCLFLGFLPHKKGRQTLFRRIADTAETVILYESPHRILKTLESLSEVVPTRNIVLVRELTKIHESVVRGIPAEVRKYFQEHQDEVRGEIVIIIGPTI